MESEEQPETPDAASNEPSIEEPLEEELAQDHPRTRIKRITIGLLIWGFFLFLIVDSFTTGYVRNGLKPFLDWSEKNPVPGFFVFMLVYFLATIIFVPAAILTLGAGYIFGNAFGLGVGILLGTLSVFFGAIGSALVSFLLGRYLLRDWAIGLTKKYAIFEALDAAIEDKGFRIMVLLRLSPIVPFFATNYFAGVTSVSLRDYSLALFALIPVTTVYVLVGASAESLVDSAQSGGKPVVTISIIVVGVVLGIAVICFTSYYVKKELKRVLLERRAVEEATGADPEEQKTNDDEIGGTSDDEIGGSSDSSAYALPVFAAVHESSPSVVQVQTTILKEDRIEIETI